MYYSFGAAVSGGSYSWSDYTTSNTKVIAKDAYHGTKYHRVKVMAKDNVLGIESQASAQSSYATLNLYNRGVVFNANATGATVDGESSKTLYVWNNNSGLYTAQKTAVSASVPVATRQGYTFKGWYTATSGGTQVYNANGALQPSVSGYTNSSSKWSVSYSATALQLYAQYEASGDIAYTVKHYTQNLTGNAYTLESSVTGYGTTGATLTLSNLTHSITGFTSPSNGFAGTATNGTTKPSSGAVTTTTILANGNRVIDLYYTRNSYEVSETHGTGIASVTGAGTYLFGASVTLTPTVSDGYTFENWTDNNNSDATVSTNAAYTFTMPANAVSYRANATPNSYNITLNKQSGTGGTSSVSVTYGYAMTPITPPTRGTYKFGGYYTGTSGSGTQYYNADGTTANNWAETNVTTLYAKWTACTACLPGNGANCSLSVENNACKYTTSCKTGYDNIQNNGKYNPSCTPNTINITLDKNGGTGTCGGVSGTSTGEMTCTYDAPCRVPPIVLPDGYTAVDYIHTNHDAYIMTDLKVTDFDQVKAEIKLYDYNTNTSSKYPALFGVTASTSSGSNNARLFRFYNNASSNGYMQAVFHSWWSSNSSFWPLSTEGKSVPLNVFKKFDIKLASGNQYIDMDGVRMASASKTATSWNNNYTLPIFAINYASTEGTYIPNLDCKYMKFYKNGNLVLDLVPAKDSSGVYGLYDMKNNRFYTSATTTGFTGSSDTTCEITNGTKILTGWKKPNGDDVALGADITNITTGTPTTLTAQWQQCAPCNTANANSVNCSIDVIDNQCVWTTSCKDGYSNIQNQNTPNASCTGNTITLNWTSDSRGTISNAPATCTYGLTFTAAKMTANAGYEFNKWSVNEKTFGSGETNVPCTQTQLGVYSGTATITPSFNTNTYNLSYNCNGGTAQSTLPATAPVAYGASYTTAANTVCTKTGYTLSGWMVGSSSSTDVKDTGEEYEWTYTADKTLYAKWTANVSGKITLNSNRFTSNTSTNAAQTATSASNPAYVYTKYNTGVYKDSNATTEITQLTSIPKMTGYTFTGFWTQKYSGGTQVTDSDGKFLAAAKTVITGTTTATWYARWSKCTECAPGTGASCELSVVNNQCVWTTSCDAGYHGPNTNTPSVPTNNGAYNPSCTGNTIGLSWDANGHGNNPSSPATCTYGSIFTTPTMTSGSGYNFSGWKNSNNQSSLVGNTEYSCDFINLGTYTDSVAFAAQWNAQEYNVTYLCGDGTGDAPANGKPHYGEPFTPAANTCTRTGYTFAGWLVSGTSDTKPEGTSFTWTYTENKTFTAQWNADSFKVRYAKSPAAATGTTPADGTCTYGTTCVAAANPYTYTGHTFTGWACSLTGGGGTCAQATYAAGDDISGATVPGGDITLTPTWDANEITLSWANGGRGTLPSDRPEECDYGSTFTMPAAMSATGYTFNGWKINSTTYAAGATVDCTMVTSGTVTITGSWTAKQYTITLDNQGGTGPTSVAGQSYGGAMKAVTPPTRTGYTFVGYFDATTGGNQYYKYNGTYFRTWNKDQTSPKLYAHWSANPYTVTFNANSGTGGTQYTTAIYDKPMPAVQPNLADPANGAIIKYNGCYNGKYPYGATTTSMYNVFLPVEPNTTYKYTDNTGNRQAIYEYNFVVNPDSYTSQGQLSPDRTINGYGIEGLPSDCFTTGANAKMVMLYLKNSSGTTPTNLKIHKVVGATCTHSTVSGNSSASAGVLSSGGTELTPGAQIERPTKTNETFNGYFDAATGGNQYYTASGESNMNWDKASDTTLYAQYKSMTVNVSGKSLTYNGTAQSCAGGATVTFPLGATITYSDSANGDYVAAANAPKITNVSESPKTIYFKASANGYEPYLGSYTCTMAKATMSASLAGNEQVYNGSALTCNGGEQTGVPAGSTIGYRTGTTGNYGNAPTITNVADTKTVYYQITNPNYNDYTGTFACTITPAEMAAPTIPTNHLVYNGTTPTNGTAQNCPGLVDYASGASVQYSTTENGTYGASTPTITNAGETTVWYKLTKTNYNDKIGSYTCTLDTKDMTVSASGVNLTYSGSAQSCAGGVTVSDPSSGATIKYTDTMGGTYSTTAPTLTNVGSKTIYYQVTAGNYTTNTGSYTCAMTTANGQLELSATSGSVTYPTTTGTFTVTTNTSGGALSVTSSNSSVATATISGTTVTITYHKAGTANITVTSAATGNYEAQTATYVATANNKTITINNNSGSGTCMGGSITCTYDATCNAPVWGGNSRIPAEYTEVEYLQSNGTTYINTELTANQNTSAEIKYSPTALYGYVTLFGARYSSSSRAFDAWARISNSSGGSSGIQIGTKGSQNPTPRVPAVANHVYVASLSSTKYEATDITGNVSGSATFSNVGNFTTPVPVWLFSLNQNGTSAKDNISSNSSSNTKFAGKIYYFRMYDGDNLIVDMVPVERNSDGKYGMYDTVRRRFFEAESGSFTGGDAVASNGDTCEITNGTKVLTGWNTAANGSGTAVALGQNNIGTLSANTLYAVWVNTSCSITNGTGTATTSVDNSPVCNVTCDNGYSKLGYMDATTNGFTTVGEPNQGTASYECVARTYRVELDAKRYTSASELNGTAPENVGTTEYWYQYKTNSPCYYYSTELQSEEDKDSVNCIGGTNGDTITVPSGMTGYNTFDGYYLGKTGTGTQYVLNTGVTTNQLWNTVPADSALYTKLYAKWNANSFNVAYANYTGATPSPTTCTYGATCNAPSASAVTKTGYTLSGWTCAASSGDCAKTTYEPGESISTATTVNGATITLTAVWTPNISGAITLDSNRYDSDDATTPVQTATTQVSPSTIWSKYEVGLYSDSNATNQLEHLTTLPKMTGYNFDGFWETKFTEPISVGVLISASNDIQAKAKKRVATTGGTATWYAHWNPKTYTLKFMNQDQQLGTLSATYDAATPVLTDALKPTRTGYTFDGYWTQAGVKYYNADYTPVIQTWTTDGGLTLYAHWTPNTYTVELNKNTSDNDTTVVDTVSATYDAAMPLVNASGANLTIPTNGDNIITGYADARSNGTLYYNVNGMNITSAKNWDKTDANSVLYAQWSECPACNATNANCSLSVVNNECHYETECLPGYHDLVGDDTATPSCTANTYTVKFVTGNNVELGTQEFTYGVSKALTTIANLDQTNIPVSSTNGWSFSGWNTVEHMATAPNTPVYTNGQSVSNLTTENGATVKLYGVWKRSVKFKYYSSATKTTTTTGTRTQYYRNSNANTAAATAVSKYTLYTQSTYKWKPVGWVLGNTTIASPLATTSITTATITPAVSAGTTSGVIYYAVYSRSATITYNVNGGTGSTDDTTATQYFNAGGTNSIPLDMTLSNGTGMSRTNYSLVGWNDSQDGTGTSYAKGATYTFPAATWTTAQTPITMYATWSQNTIHCAAGQYLPAGANACQTCPVGDYCEGGDFLLDGAEHGKTQCPTGYTSDTGASVQTQCYVNCGAGQWKPTSTGVCENVGVNYWGVGGQSFYGDALEKQQCGMMSMPNDDGTWTDKQLQTTGSGLGANEAADCGRVLHVGDYSLRLRSGTAATPSLRFDFTHNGVQNLLWAKMTTTQKNMSSESAKKFKMNYNNQTYYVCDDTTCSD